VIEKRQLNPGNDFGGFNQEADVEMKQGPRNKREGGFYKATNQKSYGKGMSYRGELQKRLEEALQLHPTMVAIKDEKGRRPETGRNTLDRRRGRWQLKEIWASAKTKN